MKTIGILGVGYVGQPLASTFAQKGLNVVGFDIDGKRIRFLRKHRATTRVIWTDNPAQLTACSTFIICVPTPLTKRNTPDLRAIKSAFRTTAKIAHKGALIVTESTTYPGATRELLVPLVEKKGLQPDKDIFIASAPERIDPGNKTFTIATTPRTIGGIGPESTRRAVALYKRIVTHIYPVSSLEAAEFTKLLENSFRLINISFMNEVSIAAEKLNLNIWEILDAASSKPFAFLRHDPGPGIGGHCIPIDPLYLQYTLEKNNTRSSFITCAHQVNQRMPRIIIDRCKKILKTLKRKHLLLIGMTYKPNVPDLRESPSIEIARLLAQKHASITYHDPYVPSLGIKGETHRSTPLTKKVLQSVDLVVILTPHDSIDWKRIKKWSRNILDTRGVLRNFYSF